MHRRSASCIWRVFINCAFPVRRAILMHRRSTSCILDCHPLPTFLRLWAIFMHRRTASFIFDVFANCAFKVRWAVFDAQAQYFVHSGLPLTSNPSPTADHFSCTGAVLHSVWVFLLTVHLTFAGLFLMHRRSTSCILGCHSLPTLLRPRAFVCTGVAFR